LPITARKPQTSWRVWPRRVGLLDERADGRASSCSATSCRSSSPRSCPRRARRPRAIPVVCRLNPREPTAYFYARAMMLRGKDVLYVSNARAVDRRRVRQLCERQGQGGLPAGDARAVIAAPGQEVAREGDELGQRAGCRGRGARALFPTFRRRARRNAGRVAQRPAAAPPDPSSRASRPSRAATPWCCCRRRKARSATPLR
jgi:hypothetical protein